MKREYRKWFSPNLQRNMELLVFGHAGEPVLYIPNLTNSLLLDQIRRLKIELAVAERTHSMRIINV